MDTPSSLPPQSAFFHAILRHLAAMTDGDRRENVHAAVGRPEVQAFFGALSGRRARKGVFITTSTFTREAREFGRQIAESVVLIDGARLADLMIEHGVGVTHYRVLRLPRVDGDYFDAE